jgi:hypothetical protein
LQAFGIPRKKKENDLEAKKLDLEIVKNISCEKKLDLVGGSTASIPLPKNLVVFQNK